jgi:hypothetical protein
MSYLEMCKAAWETDAILEQYDNNGNLQLWTSYELAGMIKDTSSFSFGKRNGAWYIWDEHGGGSAFWSFPESLLFAVMFERGWLWNGQTFEKKEGK